jgi:hypothetical protein
MKSNFLYLLNDNSGVESILSKLRPYLLSTTTLTFVVNPTLVKNFFEIYNEKF